jgi:hypothetical protein
MEAERRVVVSEDLINISKNRLSSAWGLFWLVFAQVASGNSEDAAAVPRAIYIAVHFDVLQHLDQVATSISL